MKLDTPVEELTRVGKTTASRLHRLGIYTARDLLFHFPNRYEDWSGSFTIDQVSPGQDVSIQGEIEKIKNFRSPRKRLNITEALVKDETASIQVIWFNQPFLIKNLSVGTRVSLSGKVELTGRRLILKSPKYEVIRDQETLHTGRILPIYPLSLNITQKQVGFLINHVLPLADTLDDVLPDVLRQQEGLPPLAQAIKNIHAPESMKEVQPAQERFAFAQVFFLQLQARQLQELNKKYQAPALKFFQDEIKSFVDALPFTLTDDQKKVAWAIFNDLQENQPMNRLLQGDVGSGKTVVAGLAMYNAFLSGYQSVLMAPTEVLASQHFNNFVEMFEDLDVNIALATRSYHHYAKKGQVAHPSKQHLLGAIKEGRANLVVGTHALIQPDVNFKDLSLVIVDEQHRFGVKQRKTLRQHSGDEKTMPHLLSMTATPIPRTLALVFYGDLAVSNIREMPKDRLPIKTTLVRKEERTGVYKFIAEEIEKGGQVFVVCPLIEESDKLGVTSVAQESERLAKIFTEVPLVSLHGKLSSDEKEAIMQEFKGGKTKILVATTVIEVGVDVPNATIMLIEGAERFGLSQLHQIRGRVGRGDKQSYCFLFPTEQIPATLDRLRRFIQARDGFEIAELDLQLRGAGEMLGTRQSGTLELPFVNIADTAFIEKMNQVTSDFLEKYSLNDFPLLKNHIESLNDKIHLE